MHTPHRFMSPLRPCLRSLLPSAAAHESSAKSGHGPTTDHPHENSPAIPKTRARHPWLHVAVAVVAGVMSVRSIRRGCELELPCAIPAPWRLRCRFGRGASGYGESWRLAGVAATWGRPTRSLGPWRFDGRLPHHNVVPSSSLTGAACLARRPPITSGIGTVIRVVNTFVLKSQFIILLCL